jgi:hypothetical protein
MLTPLNAGHVTCSLCNTLYCFCLSHNNGFSDDCLSCLALLLKAPVHRPKPSDDLILGIRSQVIAKKVRGCSTRKQVITTAAKVKGTPAEKASQQETALNESCDENEDVDNSEDEDAT